jgi:hypothetical protein
MDEDTTADHDVVTEFATYEDFLDSQISTLDLYYLEVLNCGIKKIAC